MHKFEKLEIWELSLDYIDLCYALAEQLPRQEEFNLSSQLRRAATSISLNIAEGSTGQTNDEQARFLGLALRSLIETVACLHLIHRRSYLAENMQLREVYQASDKLAAKIQAMRQRLGGKKYIREDVGEYISDKTPFDE